MNKRLTAVLVVLLLCASVMGAFAAKKSADIPFLANFNDKGQVDVAASIGWTEFGYGVGVSGYMTFNEFDIGPIPLSWGVAVAANAGFLYNIGLGAGAFICLDSGLDFGNIWRFEYQIGIGPALGFSLTNSWYTYDAPFAIGLGEYVAVTWWFSEKMGVTIEQVNAWSFIPYSPAMYAYTIGVEFKL